MRIPRLGRSAGPEGGTCSGVSSGETTNRSGRRTPRPSSFVRLAVAATGSRLAKPIAPPESRFLHVAYDTGGATLCADQGELIGGIRWPLKVTNGEDGGRIVRPRESHRVLCLASSYCIMNAARGPLATRQPCCKSCPSGAQLFHPVGHAPYSMSLLERTLFQVRRAVQAFHHALACPVLRGPATHRVHGGHSSRLLQPPFARG